MKWSKKSNIIFTATIMFIIAGFLLFDELMKPPIQIEDKTINFRGSGSEFLEKAQLNMPEWHDKIVLITGNVTSKDDAGCTMIGRIYCQFKEPSNIELKTNSEITLKGRVIGYDDLLEELKLDQCILIK